jgi:hypothetical protein
MLQAFPPSLPHFSCLNSPPIQPLLQTQAGTLIFNATCIASWNDSEGAADDVEAFESESEESMLEEGKREEEGWGR